MTNSDFVSLYRAAVRDLYDARGRMKALLERNSAIGIVAAMPDGPFDGANADVTKADMTAALTAAGELESHMTDFTVNPNVPTATNSALQKIL